MIYNKPHEVLVSLLFIFSSIVAFAQSRSEIKPIPPLPQQRQVEWQKLETYAFIHYGLNTYTDKEWGYGDTDLSVFNPTNLDCEQWARVCKAAGMKGIIITAKHHDGFCLWPSAYTDYSVRNTHYKNGKGDIVGELSAACKKYNLKFGVYLSPWDRHQAFYGTPLYREYFYAQLTELLTQYGDIFEVWFDGANGGDGYYGGAKENRVIDRQSYYDFPKAWHIVDSLQPNAVCFSDAGPGCRWVGNERGYAFATNWSFLRSKDVYPGYDKYKELQQGHADGDVWVAAECNTSIRPGWFYHDNEDNSVKKPAELVDLYYRSVGHNGTFLLNFPITPEGLIHPTDSANAVDFHKQIQTDLSNDLLHTAKITSSTKQQINTSALTDDDYSTYIPIYTDTILVRFKKTTALNRLLIQEYIPLGQRVEEFFVEYLSTNGWQKVDPGEETTTIGYKRILRFPRIQTKSIRIVFTKKRGTVCIANLSAYNATSMSNISNTEENKIDGVTFHTSHMVSDNVPALLFDFETPTTISSFHYTPDADRVITHYELFAGDKHDELYPISKGEFANIRNNPIEQHIYFTPISARFLMLKAVGSWSVNTIDYNEPLPYKQITIK